ncbi:hypothetical protein Tco_0060530 [Tanacetum coccineum]
MGRDTIQLEGIVSTISGVYLLEFTTEYGIPENLHPEVPSLGETIMDFPEGKVGVYTRFFEFANYRIPLSQFLFDILGHYQIHLSQLSVIGAAKVSNFKINCRVHNIIPTLNLFRVFYIPSFNSGWMSFSKRPGKNTPQCYTKPRRRNIAEYRPCPLPKITRKPIMPSRAKSELLPWGRQMNLFSLIRNPNPFKVKTGTRPCAAHEVPLLTAMTSRVIDMEDPTVASGSSGTPSTVERAKEHVQEGLAHEIPPLETATTTKVVQEAVHEEEVAATELTVNKRRKQMRRKRVNKEAEANAPPKVLRKDHASGPAHSTCGGKSLAAMGLDAGSTFSPPAAQNTPTAVIDPEPLSYAKPQSHPVQDIAQSSKGAAAEIPLVDVAITEVNVQLFIGSTNSRKSISPSVGGSPGGIYQPGWGVTKNCRMDSPEACQDMVDHIVPPGYFSELRHLHNTEFLSQYNMNLAREVAMGSQLRLKFEQEVRLLKKATTKIARRDQKIQAREEEIKKLDKEIRSLRTVETEVHGLRNRTQNLETLLEAEVDIKKAAEAKSVDLAGELSPLGHWACLCLAIMKCAKSTELRHAFADVVFAGIVKGMSEGLKYGVEHGEAKLDLAAIEAYDPEAETKYVATLTALKDLKYPLVDQLEKLRDAPIDLLMASLHLESDSGEDAPEWIRELRPDTSQIKIPIYLEVRNPRDPWSIQEEMLLEDAIAANRSHAEKKKKCRVVCRTHGVGSAHHARSDGIPVSAPTVAPQGLAILLADAAVHTKASKDEASPRLLRSKSLPPMYNLDWP